MDEIGKILFNRLASRESLWLPCVGTFGVRHTPAAELADGSITPPLNEIVFTDSRLEGVASVTDFLHQQPGGETPQEKYDRWLAKASERGPVVIEGIGVVNNSLFTPYESLKNALNPIPAAAGAQVKAAGSRKGLTKGDKAWIVLIILFLLTLAGGWTWWYKNNEGQTGRDRTRTHNPAVTDNLDRVPEQTGTIGQTEETDPLAEEITAAEQTPVQTVTREEPSVAATGSATAGYYVVGGVFSIQENADKYIRQMKAKYPDLDYVKHPYQGNKILVSLYGSTDRADANRNRIRIEDKILEFDLWLYEKK